jgi:hypothetical protein
MKNKQQTNKERVLEAFDTLFNKRDYAAAEPGLSSISCAWKAAFWLNTGT